MEIHQGYWVIGISLLIFIVFYAISFVPRIHGRLFGPALHDQYLRGQVLIQRLNGIVILGAVTLFILIVFLKQNPTDYGLAMMPQKALWYILVGALVILPISFFNGRTDSNLAAYPEIRFHRWTPARVSLSLISQAVYIIGYEFFFRGFLFFGCYYAFGLWTSIAINVTFYVLAHGMRKLKQIIGAVPFGIYLCYITYDTQSILPAILVHLILAWSNELLSIHYHPKMKFVGKTIH